MSIELQGTSPEEQFADGKIVYCGYREIEFIKKTKDPYPSINLYPNNGLYPANLLIGGS